ncbi:hypothetical protein [Carboxylicivirga marina]|uniref:Conjugative transposon TraJ C-terminal domain-containing protein n=1 Tax=Carboxylicivirga marina TaxID=2800988 RepID=A0ABS1HKQ5_9BACT|nr:hypothetical protein [Carboxylicivirga marina]MBK3518259.1 hypothetical protein [Carboxylicivirga marina]
MNIENFFQFTDNLIGIGMDNARLLVDMARAIGGIAAFLYIAKRIFEQLIADNPIMILPLLRPFALVLVITFWGAFINILMVPTQGLTHLSEAIYSNRQEEVSQKLQEKQSVMLNTDLPLFEENQEKEADLWDKGINVLLTTYNIVSGRAIRNQINYYIMEGIRQVTEVVFEVVVYLIAFLRTIFCVLLIIFGPLVFALSIFDGFQDNYLQWIARFVSVNLYLPIALIILSLTQHLLIYVLDVEINMMNQMGFYQSSLFFVSGLIVPLCGICGLMMVPKVATWIINASGTSTGGGRMLRTAAMMAVSKGALK